MIRDNDNRESEGNTAAEAFGSPNDLDYVWILIVIAGKRLGNPYELCLGKITLETNGSETTIIQHARPSDIRT